MRDNRQSSTEYTFSAESIIEALFWRWLEYESIAMCPAAPAMNRIRESYVIRRDELGNFHKGCFDLRSGKWLPNESSFIKARSNVPQHYVNERVTEFGIIFIKMDELDQGLVIMDNLGGETEWREHLTAIGLSERLAKRRLDQIWLYLLFQCRKRGLV